MALVFQWDPKKAAGNLTKHGVSFAEAASIFADHHSITKIDFAHSVGERRLITIGLSNTTKLLVVAHTERGDNIRVISARAATRRERKQYEETR